MKHLFIWISDVHISIKNLLVSIQVLKEALDLARNRNVPLLISGDLNDTKAVMRSEWVSALIKLFEEYKDVKIYILTGNHDMDNKNSNTHSLEFLKPISNIIMMDEPGVHYISGHPFYCIPYCINTETFKAALDKARANGIKKVIAHQGVLGSFMGDYIVDESSIDPKEFEDFDIVMLGHYHKFQKNLNYVYCGSPFTTNFGEADQIKFIHEVGTDEENTAIVFNHHETKARRHIKYLIEADEDLAKIKNVPGSLAQIVVKGPKEFVKKYNDVPMMKQLSGAESVLIVPEISRQSEHRIAAEILHSPLKVIDAYLASAETILDKDKLKDYLFTAAQDLLTSFSSNSSKSFNITRATAKNFLSFKDLDFTYSAMGLTLVEGFDEDRGINTGAGKSSFFDVIIYGLFGQTSKDIKADEVINRIAKKDCEINLYLTANDGEYVLKRFRKHSQFDNDLVLVFPNGKELRGKDNRETQKFIEQELGCSYDLFLKSSYFTQFGAIDRFLSASDTEKKKLVSEITDLSIYDNILDKIKSTLKLNQDILSGQEKELLKAQTAYDTTSKYLSQEIVNRDQWEDNNRNKIAQLKLQCSEWDKEHEAKIQIKRDGKLSFDVEKEAKIANAKINLEDYEAKKLIRIAALEQEKLDFDIRKEFKIQQLREATTTAQDKADLLFKEIKELEAQGQASEQLTEDLKALNVKIDLIEKMQAKAMKLEFSDIASLSKEISQIQIQINQEKNKLENNLNGTCPQCYQEIAPSCIQKVIDDLEKEVVDLHEKRVIYQNNLTEIKKLIDNKPFVLAEKEKIYDQLSKAKSVNDVIKAKYNEQTALVNATKDYSSQIANQELTKSNAGYQITIVQTEVNPFSKILEDLAASINPYIAIIQNLTAEVNPFNKAIESETMQQNPFILTVEAKEKDLNVQQVHKVAIQIEVNYTLQAITYGEWWKMALHVYIKSYLMDSCLDQINDHTNSFLQTLFDGALQFNITATTEAGKDTKEKIDISIINNGDECSYQSLSGGERCRICLAVNLALSQIISKTNGKNFGMIFLDEILNGLDEAGKSQSMKLLKELELQYPSVFIIDHAEGFKSLFTNSIMIKKKDKVSYIV